MLQFEDKAMALSFSLTLLKLLLAGYVRNVFIALPEVRRDGKINVS